MELSYSGGYNYPNPSVVVHAGTIIRIPSHTARSALIYLCGLEQCE